MRPFYVVLAYLTVAAPISCWAGSYWRARRLQLTMPRLRDMPIQIGLSIAFAWVGYAVAAQIAVAAKASAVIDASVRDARAPTDHEIAEIESMRKWTAPFGQR